METQTDLIVQAIQVLLGSMRNSTTFGPEFKDIIRGITVIVSEVIQVSEGTLKSRKSEYRERGELILKELGSSNKKLEELGVSMIEQPQNKSIKQKLAASSYEIAKVCSSLFLQMMN